MCRIRMPNHKPEPLAILSSSDHSAKLVLPRSLARSSRAFSIPSRAAILLSSGDTSDMYKRCRSSRFGEYLDIIAASQDPAGTFRRPVKKERRETRSLTHLGIPSRSELETYVDGRRLGSEKEAPRTLRSSDSTTNVDLVESSRCIPDFSKSRIKIRAVCRCS